jgi:hypothetical protein
MRSFVKPSENTALAEPRRFEASRERSVLEGVSRPAGVNTKPRRPKLRAPEERSDASLAALQEGRWPLAPAPAAPAAQRDALARPTTARLAADQRCGPALSAAVYIGHILRARLSTHLGLLVRGDRSRGSGGARSQRCSRPGVAGHRRAKRHCHRLGSSEEWRGGRPGAAPNDLAREGGGTLVGVRRRVRIGRSSCRCGPPPGSRGGVADHQHWRPRGFCGRRAHFNAKPGRRGGWLARLCVTRPH